MASLPKQLPAPREEQNQLATTGGALERSTAHVTPASHYQPDRRIADYGLRGYARTLRIFWFIALLTLKLYLDWFVRLSPDDVEGRLRRLCHWLAVRLIPSSALSMEEIHSRRALWLLGKLERLGPAFIKIGQTLSTRPDLVPVPYTKELAKLQDEVPAFPQPVAWSTIEAELGAAPEEIFASIDPQPIAAASIGQVYRARLKTGEVVAVKVQRPHLEEAINLDLAIVRESFAYIERKYPQAFLGIEWQPIVAEFAAIIFEEMDYLQEGDNAETFARHFAGWPQIYVPKIFWQYTSRRVLVEEFIDGLKVDDVEGIRARQLDPLEVVKLISRTYLKQLLEDGFFHADPHPGNLRLMPDGRLAFFDFGMVGRITQEMQTKLVDCFFHIVEKDVHGLVEDLIELKFLKEGFDPEEFRPTVEEIFSHYIGMKLGQLKFKELSQAISETIYRLPFTIPSNFTFVMRALTTLEGIGLLVDPTFSFFDTVKPYAKEFMLKRESRYLRDRILGKLVRGEDGKISWGKVWKLAKMAIKHYFTSDQKTNHRDTENIKSSS